MIRIVVTVRNRLAITKKCIEAIKQHTINEHMIYVFDNSTNYKLDKHLEYFSDCFEKGIIDFFAFTNNKSTYNAFSKAVTLNFFGHMINENPSKNKDDLILILDNDMIVQKKWDKIVLNTWAKIEQEKMNVHIVTQWPGGTAIVREIKFDVPHVEKAFLAVHGGSGFWCLRNNFFKEIGFLDLKQLVGLHKKHDQLYWRKLHKMMHNNAYTLCIKAPLAYHCGKLSGSVCNVLTKTKDEEQIYFEEAEKKIERMSFEKFLDTIKKIEGLDKW